MDAVLLPARGPKVALGVISSPGIWKGEERAPRRTCGSVLGLSLEVARYFHHDFNVQNSVARSRPVQGRLRSVD